MDNADHPIESVERARIDKIVRHGLVVLQEVGGQAQHASERAKGSVKLYLGRQSNDRLSLAADPSVYLLPLHFVFILADHHDCIFHR